MGVFVFTFLHVIINIFYTLMSACFKDYDFGIMEFVLLVNIVASFVVCLLSLLLLFSLGLLLLFILVLLLLLSLYLNYLCICFTLILMLLLLLVYYYNSIYYSS